MKSDSLSRFMNTPEFKSLEERWNADSYVRNVIAVSPGNQSKHSREGSQGETLNEKSSEEQKEEMEYVL